MEFKAFKHIRKYAEEMMSDEAKGKLDEYLYIVSYHSNFAQDAARQCSSALTDSLLGFTSQINIDPINNSVYLFGFSLEAIIRHGDVAIREAISAIDAGLLLTNYIVGTNIKQAKLYWGNLRQELVKSSDTYLQTLEKVIQAVIDSIGYDYLKRYRNWVTHRGAPRIKTKLKLPGPIPVPPNIFDHTNPDNERWQLTSYLMTEIPRQIYVQCVPFHPPVMLIYNATLEGGAGPITLPGNVFVDIEKGSSVFFDNTMVSTGSLFENRERYSEHHKVKLELDRTKIAGETLVTYQIADYIEGVKQLTSFVQETLSDEWDKQLEAFCRTRRALTDKS